MIIKGSFWYLLYYGYFWRVILEDHIRHTPPFYGRDRLMYPLCDEVAAWIAESFKKGDYLWGHKRLPYVDCHDRINGKPGAPWAWTRPLFLKRKWQVLQLKLAWGGR